MQSHLNLLEHPPEPQAREENCFPASLAQERIWFLEKLEPGSPLYNLAGAVRLQGTLNHDALKQSVIEIVRRHEIFRTSFLEVEGTLLQKVHNQLRLQFLEKDLRGVADQTIEEELKHEARRGFVLGQPGLLRVRLLQISAREHVVVVVMHHIIADGWSIVIFMQELKALYEACVQSRPSPLPELPLQYADYSVWQREMLASGEMQEGLEYWKKQLAGAPPILELPCDFPRGSKPDSAGATVRLNLGKECTGKLGQFARHEGVTLYMALLAAFQTFLWRYSGQHDVVVGGPMAERRHRESENLIGLFANLLPLRTRFSDGLTFVELLQQVKRTVAAAQAHQHVPFEKVVDEVAQDRALSHMPLVQVVFSWQDGLMPNLRLGELEGKLQHIETGTAKFELTLTLQQEQGEIVGGLEYRSSLFRAATVEQFSRHFIALLESALSRPAARLRELQFLSGPDKEQVLCWSTGTPLPLEQETNVLTMFAEHVRRSPQSVAVECAGQKLTCAELDLRSNQLARYFQKLGVKQESLVGVCMERSPETLVALLAVLKCGAAYVSLDASYPADRLQYMLEDAGVQVLCTHTRLLKKWEKCAGAKCSVVAIDDDGDSQRIASESSSPVAVHLSPEDLAYVIYTSGSTGRPKGMQVTHRSLRNLCRWHHHAFNLAPGDRSTQVASMGFDASVWEIWSAVTAGATLCFVPEEMRLDPVRLRDWLVREKITVSFLPTPLAESIIALDWPQSDSLRALLTGGDKLRHVPSHLPFLLSNNYGPTECAVVATSGTVDLDVLRNAPPIGRSISNTQAYVLDREMQLVPAGVTGELYLGGEGVGRGYLRHPQLTAEKFVPDPFSSAPGARLYRTGDLAHYLPDGQLRFIGRADEQVKLRGYRIEPEEIASVLRKVGGVRDAVVLVRGGEGEAGEPRLVAYVVPQADAALNAAELRQHARRHLPDYMVPAACVFLKEFPLTANGKLDRKALPEASPETESSGPLTATEELVAGVWASLLGTADIQRESNFFTLGGHSLLVAQLSLRLRQIFGCELPLRTIFEFPVLSDLASHLETLIGQAQSSSRSSITPVSREGNLRLSSAQERLWFLDRFTGSGSAYNIAGAARLTGALNTGALNKDALKQSLSEIVHRHDVLRTSFAEVNGQPVQKIHSEVRMRFEERDLRGPSGIADEKRIQGHIRELAERRFILSEPSLLRVELLQVAGQSWVLAIVMHHIIADGWSIGVLVRELKELYEAYLQAQPSALPQLEIQYADYAAWEHQLQTSGGLREGLDYWKQQLTGAPPVLELPTDFPRTGHPSYKGGIVRSSLGLELSSRLDELGHREGATLFMVLLAGFQLLLSRYTGQRDIVTGTDIANRNQPGTEGLIGLFVNQLVLRTNLSGNPSFRELIARVREMTLAAYTHQHVPFGKVVEMLQPKRDFSRNPLFQVMVIFQQAPVPRLQFGGLELEPMEIDMESSVFDLSLGFIVEGNGEVRTFLRHRDLFKTATAQRMLQDLVLVLESMVKDPDLRVSNVEVGKMHEAKTGNRKDDRFNKLLSTKPKQAVVPKTNLVSSENLLPGQSCPIVFRPEVEDVDLSGWIAANRPQVLEKLSTAGAVLFRGFKIETLPQFRTFTQSVCPELIEYGERSSPRTKIDDGVYTSTDHPADQPIVLHNEQSYTLNWPLKIWFFCMQPSLTGGCTPIADSRKILKRLQPQTVEKFVQKQVMYMRNYGDGLGLNWPDVFQTTDKAAVEQHCREASIEFEWKDKNRLRTRQVRPAVRQHPRTLEETWFNHMLFFNITSLPAGVRAAFTSGIEEQDLPFNTYYGDGSPIEAAVLEEVREAYDRETIAFPWEKNDILMVDNMLVAHGRQPFTGPRKIVVAMAEPFNGQAAGTAQ